MLCLRLHIGQGRDLLDYRVSSTQTIIEQLSCFLFNVTTPGSQALQWCKGIRLGADLSRVEHDH
jgi:hypothetical protein